MVLGHDRKVLSSALKLRRSQAATTAWLRPAAQGTWSSSDAANEEPVGANRLFGLLNGGRRSRLRNGQNRRRTAASAARGSAASQPDPPASGSGRRARPRTRARGEHGRAGGVGTHAAQGGAN